MNRRAERVIQQLGLVPLPDEGGFFRETYRSMRSLEHSALSERYSGSRNLSTAIYYLLTDSCFSALHRLPGDEVFHFYSGDAVEMTLLFPDGRGETVTLGNQLDRAESPQVVVPGGVWQGSRLKREGSADCHGYALLGTTMAPGFDFQDFQLGDRSALLAEYPSFRESILTLTRTPAN